MPGRQITDHQMELYMTYRKTDRRRPGKRGPKTELSDAELAKEIGTVLSQSPFLGEGHRKVKVRPVDSRSCLGHR